VSFSDVTDVSVRPAHAEVRPLAGGLSGGVAVALSYKDDVRDSLADSVFTRGALSKPLPKYKFPEKESLAADVFQIVQDELFLDGNARQNLATFC
jgi:hypothetical protein